MSARFATLMGLIGAAAVSIWYGKRRQRQAETATELAFAPDYLAEDDEVADIIRRARPALERAGRLAAAWNH